MGIKAALKLLLTCFKEPDNNSQSCLEVDTPLPPRVVEEWKPLKVNKVSFVSPNTETEPVDMPVNLSESIDDMENDCIKIAMRATENAALINSILDYVMETPAKAEPPRPKIGIKPHYSDSKTYELE